MSHCYKEGIIRNAEAQLKKSRKLLSTLHLRLLVDGQCDVAGQFVVVVLALVQSSSLWNKEEVLLVFPSCNKSLFTTPPFCL